MTAEKNSNGAAGLQTLFFDLYGTLVDIRTGEDSPAAFAALAEACAAFGCAWQPEVLRGAYAELTGWLLAEAAARPGFPEPDFSFFFAGLLGSGATTQRVARLAWVFRQASTQKCRLYPGAAAFLQAARRAGLRCALLSNAQSLYTRPELEQLGLLPLLDPVVLSSEIGWRKPGRRFFAAGLAAAGTAPANALMVGNDGLCDIAGGRGAGLRTACFHTETSPAADTARTTRADFWFDGADFAGLAARIGVTLEAETKTEKGATIWQPSINKPSARAGGPGRSSNGSGTCC